jgi:hypothetical protein
MKSLLLLAAALVLSATTHAAAPSIHVGAMYEYAAPGQGALLKRVRNTGDATAFVRVEITEVRYGDDGKPFEVAVDTAGAGEGGDALVASPSRLIVPAQGQQATRLLFQGDRSVERYYRVRFVPVLPKREDEFALSDAEAKDYREGLSAGVNVLTGYGVFVIVHPDAPVYDTRTETDAVQRVVRNAGNTTVVLDDVRQCAGDGKAGQCSPPRRIHLLPQRAESFARGSGHLHRFEIVEGDARKSVLLSP